MSRPGLTVGDTQHLALGLRRESHVARPGSRRGCSWPRIRLARSQPPSCPLSRSPEIILGRPQPPRASHVDVCGKSSVTAGGGGGTVRSAACGILALENSNECGGRGGGVGACVCAQCQSRPTQFYAAMNALKLHLCATIDQKAADQPGRHQY